MSDWNLHKSISMLNFTTILGSHQFRYTKFRGEIALSWMICGMTAISESVILLSFWVNHDVIVISKNTIVLPYSRVSCLFKWNLWHEHDQCNCQSIARKEKKNISNCINYSYLPSRRKHFSINSRDEKFYPEHYVNDIHKYICHHIPN